MGIERLIQREVESLPPDAPCIEAARLMRETGVGCVVVAEDGRPLGVVTDRDLVLRVIAPGRDPAKEPLRDIMAGEPIFLGSERRVEEVLQTMSEQGVRRMPVVDEEGLLEGIVTMDDLLLVLAQQLGWLADAVRRELKPRHGAIRVPSPQRRPRRATPRTTPR
jgi:CBS domain-containing protein